MDDELPVGVWSIDPDTRAALRLDRVRRLMREQVWVEAIVEIEELLDEEPDHAEGLFLLGEALLEIGEYGIALQSYARHIELTGGDARSFLGLAVSRFETCDLVGSVEAAREALRLDASLAEGHWYLGLALERLPGGGTESTRALATARELDPEQYPFPLRVDDRTWKRLISDALKVSHPEVQRFWKGVPARIEDWPQLDELRSHDPPIPPTVACLYAGDPPDDQDPWEARPKALRVFRRNLERSRDLDELVEQLSSALHTEALDWLGLVDDSELDG